jgi:hypothetical protein
LLAAAFGAGNIFMHNVHAQGDALITNMHGWAGNEFFHFMLAFAAE